MSLTDLKGNPVATLERQPAANKNVDPCAGLRVALVKADKLLARTDLPPRDVIRRARSVPQTVLR